MKLPSSGSYYSVFHLNPCMNSALSGSPEPRHLVVHSDQSRNDNSSMIFSFFLLLVFFLLPVNQFPFSCCWVFSCCRWTHFPFLLLLVFTLVVDSEKMSVDIHCQFLYFLFPNLCATCRNWHLLLV